MNYGQWWNEDDKFTAYYLCLRNCYEMKASEAYKTARDNFARYPEFFRDPVNTLREAIK